MSQMIFNVLRKVTYLERPSVSTHCNVLRLDKGSLSTDKRLESWPAPNFRLVMMLVANRKPILDMKALGLPNWLVKHKERCLPSMTVDLEILIAREIRRIHFATVLLKVATKLVSIRQLPRQLD